MTNARERFSLVTNASALDAERLRLTVPHWLRVFGDRLSELVIVVDPQPPSGRIAALHGGTGSLAEVRAALAELVHLDPRIDVRDLPSGEAMDAMLAGWFRRERPIRCQAGTPIAAFIAAFESAGEPFVLRADCDILFHEAGWLDVARRELTEGRLDLAEPARCGEPSTPRTAISSRALMLHMPHWRPRMLPIRAWRLDRLRQVHRWWQNRPPWLPLEEMLEKERGRGLRHAVLPENLGFALHIGTRSEARLPIMPTVVAAVEAGAVPASQQAHGMNFSAAAW